MKDETKIQKVPKKRLTKVLPAAERRRRIKAWIELLSQLPFCHMAQTPYEIESLHVRDNPEEFLNAVLVCQIDYDINHPEMYAIMYCCFLNDGSFIVKSDYPKYSAKFIAIIEVETGLRLLINKDGQTAKTWTQGYGLMVRMINEAYKMSVPEPPAVH